MQFHHTLERSTEVLRQALPLMSRQAAALHPISYAVWYAYVADACSPLRLEVDRLLAQGGRLDEPTTEALYHRHVAGLDADTVTRVSDGLHAVLGGMTAQAAEANDQTKRYGDVLERLAAQLAEQMAGQAPPEAGAETAPDLPLPPTAPAPPALTGVATPPLLPPPAPAVMATDVVGELLAQTQKMQEAMAQLQQRLESNQREIHDLRDEVQRARQDSLVDGLTGLANRRAFDRRFQECLSNATAQGQPGPCLLLADLDHFKKINDTYGHGFGDQVLRTVGQLLGSLVQGQGLAARVGGEEFGVLLPATALDEAHAVAERLRLTVAANRIRRKGQQDSSERVTLSIGAAAWRPGDGTQTLFDRADRALYAAKSRGRDRVEVDG